MNVENKKPLNLDGIKYVQKIKKNYLKQETYYINTALVVEMNQQFMI